MMARPLASAATREQAPFRTQSDLRPLCHRDPSLWARASERPAGPPQVSEEQLAMKPKLLSLLKLTVGVALFAGIAALTVWRLLG